MLKKDGYLAVFIGDMYNQGRYHFLSADLARMLEHIGLILKANIVWMVCGPSRSWLKVSTG